MISNQQLLFIKQQAFSFFNSGSLSQAKTQCQNYCNYKQNDPEAWCLLSAINGALELYNESEQYARKSLSISPNYSQAQFNLGVALLNLNRMEEAIDEFSTVIQSRPDHGIAHYLKGKGFLLQTGQLHKAKPCFEKALKLIAKPPKDLLLDLAQLYVQLGDNKKFLNIIEKLIKENPLDPQAGVLMAAQERRENKLDAARKRLELLRDSGLDLLPDIARVENNLGLVLDRLGEYDKAFDSFTKSQEAIKKSLALQYNNEFWYQRIKSNKKFITAENIKHWQHKQDDNLPAPAFLVGFPRSGTTLTEKIISSHPKVSSSDEYSLVYDVFTKMMSLPNTGSNYPESLNELTQDNIKALRKEYWDIARKKCNAKPGKRLFLDKMPLNIIELCLINRIFPEAKILVLIRDPRDACLSCFMQLFKTNDAMNNFLDLDNTARFYDATMDLFHHYEAVLDMNVYKFHYEDLVANLEKESKKIFDFLGIEWNENILEYHKKKSRTISTPSYQDVSKPVYTRASGRWKNYQQQLQPVMDRLQPYIEVFGYNAM